jgi:hypothetical protein
VGHAPYLAASVRQPWPDPGGAPGACSGIKAGDRRSERAGNIPAANAYHMSDDRREKFAASRQGKPSLRCLP